MSIWRPYVSEVPLDLSKDSASQGGSSQESPSASVDISRYGQFPGYLPAIMQQYAGAVEENLAQYGFLGPYQQLQAASQDRATPSPPESLDSNKSNSKSCSSDLDALTAEPAFKAFKKNALAAMGVKDGVVVSNPRMRRIVKAAHDSADVSYRQQRMKNNQAAKQSRDKRKQRELDMVLMATFLNSEMVELKAQLAAKKCDGCGH